VAGVTGMGVPVGVGGDGRSHPAITRVNRSKKAAVRAAMFIKTDRLTG
jgi:hypothetical protein